LLAAVAGEPGTNTIAVSIPHANSDLTPLLIEIPLVASARRSRERALAKDAWESRR